MLAMRAEIQCRRWLPVAGKARLDLQWMRRLRAVAWTPWLTDDRPYELLHVLVHGRARKSTNHVIHCAALVCLGRLRTSRGSRAEVGGTSPCLPGISELSHSSSAAEGRPAPPSSGRDPPRNQNPGSGPAAPPTFNRRPICSVFSLPHHTPKIVRRRQLKLPRRPGLALVLPCGLASPRLVPRVVRG